jgi:AcrR family transcriptional regulator
VTESSVKTGLTSSLQKRPTVGLGLAGSSQTDRQSVCQQELSNRELSRVPDRSNKNIERGQATREHLIAVATQLFASRGYEGTSVEAVQQGAGVSRGSLYHHFASKDALFEAVVEEIETRAGTAVIAAAEGTADAVAGLRAGCLAWVRLAGDPVVQRILLIDAPSVLGWQRWREMEEAHALGLMKAALAEVADDGRLPPDLVNMFAHTLLASVNEVALLVARADDPGAAMKEGAYAVDALLQRLLG